MNNQAILTEEDTLLCFEFPLTEKMRNLLRIEYLFNRFEKSKENQGEYIHHFSLSTLFEIMECASRADFKISLLKELERQKNIYTIDNYPELYQELSTTLNTLQGVQQKFGQNLRDNGWLMHIQRRMMIAGGTGPFDSCSYFYWQKLPFEERVTLLNEWVSLLLPTSQAVNLLLSIIRKQHTSEECEAIKGSYEHTGPGKHIQLIQIHTPYNEKAVPEISANRHLMYIRFTHLDFTQARGKPITHNIPFKLSMCSFEGSQIYQ